MTFGPSTHKEALEEIDALEAEIGRLRAALEEIASYATNPGDEDYMQRIARKALANED